MATEIDLQLIAASMHDIASLSIAGASPELVSVVARRTAASQGKALSDGSFPIRNAADLQRAVQAFGRAKDKARTKRFILKRARELDRMDLVPDDWKTSPKKSFELIALTALDLELPEAPDPQCEFSGATTGGNSTEARSKRPYNRYPVGAEKGLGGQFAPGKARDAQAQKKQDAPGAKDLYQRAMSAGKNLPGVLHGMKDADLVKLTGVIYSEKTSDKNVVAVRLAVAAEMARRGYDVKDHGARGGGINSDKKAPAEDTTSKKKKTSTPKKAPRDHDGAKITQEYEDGSAKYTDGWTWDPDTGKFRKPRSTTAEVEAEEFSETEFVKAPGPCSLDKSAKHNWVEDVGGLPNYICQVARAVARGGKTLDSAIPIAINTIKRWAAGAGDVSPAVRARAVAALAEWEAKKARAHANGATVETFDLSDEDNQLIEMLVDFATGPQEKKLPTDAKPYVRTDATIKRNPVGIGRRGPYRKSGRHIYRNKRKVVLKLDGKPDGRSLRTNYKRFPSSAPAGLGGQFAPLGRGVKATKKKYGTAASLEDNMAAELAGLGDQVVIKDGPNKGKHGKVIGRAPKKDQHLVRIGDKVTAVAKDNCEKKNIAVTASGAALWDEDQFSYFWDEASDSTFRINTEDSSVQVYDGSIMDWTGTDLTSEEVSVLPEVDDCDSLEALVGAGEPEAEEDDTLPAAETVKETADLAADTKKDEDVEKPEGSGEGGGPRFRIPLLIPEATWSGDRRRFSKDSLEVKEPPFPLLWQKETDEGHKRSVIVGRVDKASRLESGGVGDMEGVFDTHPDAVEAARQVRGKFVTGVSGDVDRFDHELAQDENGKETIEIKHGRVVAATIVAKPAFQEATIEIIPEEGEEPTAVTASGGPLHPSQSWFQPPAMTEPYMFTVEDDGRCHGLIAEWGSEHTGNPQWKPPHSFSGYRHFNRKPVRTAEGTDVRCGQLTLTGGHPELSLDPDAVVRHYDDTRSAVADVVVGENEFGIWAAGAMRPDVTPEQVRAFRASEPSGDWRMRDGQLELLAVCMVNTAGFPVMPRALVASGDKVVALVAAGMASHVHKVSLSDQVEQLSALVATLQNKLEERISPLEAESEARRRMELSASIQALRR